LFRACPTDALITRNFFFQTILLLVPSPFPASLDCTPALFVRLRASPALLSSFKQVPGRVPSAANFSGLLPKYAFAPSSFPYATFPVVTCWRPFPSSVFGPSRTLGITSRYLSCRASAQVCRFLSERPRPTGRPSRTVDGQLLLLHLIYSLGHAPLVQNSFIFCVFSATPSTVPTRFSPFPYLSPVPHSICAAIAWQIIDSALACHFLPL